MRLMINILVTFTLVILTSGISFGGGKLIPRHGAEPTGHEKNGEPIYLLKDLLPSGSRTMELQPGDEFATDEDGDQSPLIYSGTKSVIGEFKPMGWLGNCTGTAVGPRVYLTAAHCTNNNARGQIKLRANQKVYPATCTRHPQVNTRTWYNDYALCKIDSLFDSDVQLASFDTTNRPTAGYELLLNGYGAPNVAVHYWGKATVRTNQSQDIVSCGPSNLGGGDSGGALLRWTNDRVNGWLFKIIGINSRGSSSCSYFNSTADQSFITWIKKYAADNGVEICGINKVCTNQQPEPPTPPSDCASEQKTVDYLKLELSKAEERLQMCK